jgi:predicted dehydrogenase
MRWLPQPARVLARSHAFTPTRIDPTSGARRRVGTPDSVAVLVEWPDGARGCYQFSGVTPFGQEGKIVLMGTAGVLCYDLIGDRLHGASQTRGGAPGALDELPEIPIPLEKAGGWRVEADFVDSIRTGAPVRFTDFAAGAAYMEFTEAVARSALTGAAVALPLAKS